MFYKNYYTTNSSQERNIVNITESTEIRLDLMFSKQWLQRVLHPKGWSIFNALHGTIFQRADLFKSYTLTVITIFILLNIINLMADFKRRVKDYPHA
jgi:hypothetical protein